MSRVTAVGPRPYGGGLTTPLGSRQGGTYSGSCLGVTLRVDGPGRYVCCGGASSLITPAPRPGGPAVCMPEGPPRLPDHGSFSAERILVPKLNFSRPHTLAPADAKTKVEALVDDFKSQYSHLLNKVTWASDGMSATAEGRGFTSKFKVDARTVTVEIDLSFIATPLKGKIETRVNDRLDATFPKP